MSGVKYNCTVDLSSVPMTKNNKNYKWKDSIGCVIPFDIENGDLTGEFKIVDYKIPEGMKQYRLFLTYNGDELYPIHTNNFKNGLLSNLMRSYYTVWKYNIGDIVNGKIVITKREKHVSCGNMRKRYQFKCLKCGYECGEHYFNGKYRREYWARNPENGCPCCSSRICVPGINDINTVEKWMVDYFYDENDACKYTPQSRFKIKACCPDCGEIKDCSIARIYESGRLPCICNDCISYPNKFTYYTFSQLKGQLDYYEREWSPEWAGFYRYDNYFVIGENEYVVEIDGELGHGRSIFKKSGKDVDGLKRDKEKEKLLFEKNIMLIRIDIPYYRNNYLLKMREAIENALSFLFDFSNVDWDLIYNSVYKNTKKLVCEYYMENKENHVLIRDIANIFSISENTVTAYLKEGRNYGWCDYMTPSEIKKEKYWNTINYFNMHPNATAKEVALYLNYCPYVVQNYLNDGNKNGDCVYDGYYRMTHANTRPIAVYKDGVELLHYESIKDCSRHSLEDFGIFFGDDGIYRSLRGVNKSGLYKGYQFKYINQE